VYFAGDEENFNKDHADGVRQNPVRRMIIPQAKKAATGLSLPFRRCAVKMEQD